MNENRLGLFAEEPVTSSALAEPRADLGDGELDRTREADERKLPWRCMAGGLARSGSDAFFNTIPPSFLLLFISVDELLNLNLCSGTELLLAEGEMVC